MTVTEQRRPSVAIVIVVWNGKDDTLECLRSLARDTYPNKRVIMVDNGSTDESAAEVRVAFPETIVLETGKNLGFTGGNNVGIRHAVEAGFDYVFLLNNDTIVETHALSELVAAAEANPRLGVLAPVIHYYDAPDDIWFAGSRLELSSGAAWHDNSCQPKRDEAPYEVPWATGCAMLIRGGLIHEMGGFDDRYYLTWEDVDLSIRVRKAGFTVAAVPAARIYHKGGRSGRRMPESQHYYAVRNSLLLVRKHREGLGYWNAARRIVVYSMVRCWRICRSEPRELARYVRTTFAGIIDHLTGRYGAFRPR
jgi:GT2 family glycosyltransferase